MHTDIVCRRGIHNPGRGRFTGPGRPLTGRRSPRPGRHRAILLATPGQFYCPPLGTTHWPLTQLACPTPHDLSELLLVRHRLLQDQRVRVVAAGDLDGRVLLGSNHAPDVGSEQCLDGMRCRSLVPVTSVPTSAVSSWRTSGTNSSSRLPSVQRGNPSCRVRTTEMRRDGSPSDAQRLVDRCGPHLLFPGRGGRLGAARGCTGTADSAVGAGGGRPAGPWRLAPGMSCLPYGGRVREPDCGSDS